MSGDEVAIVAIVFGSVVTVVFMGIVASIIKTAIKRKSGNLSENKEFLAALREFKEHTEQRLNHLEEIVSDDAPITTTSKKQTKRPEQKSAIEIEISSEPEQNQTKESGKLKNMLNH